MGNIDTKVISENTPIRLGLLLVGGGLVVGAIWWAAVLQTKVDTLLQIVAPQNITIGDHEKRLIRIESKLSLANKD